MGRLRALFPEDFVEENQPQEAQETQKGSRLRDLFPEDFEEGNRPQEAQKTQTKSRLWDLFPEDYEGPGDIELAAKAGMARLKAFPAAATEMGLEGGPALVEGAAGAVKDWTGRLNEVPEGGDAGDVAARTATGTALNAVVPQLGLGAGVARTLARGVRSLAAPLVNYAREEVRKPLEAEAEGYRAQMSEPVREKAFGSEVYKGDARNRTLGEWGRKIAAGTVEMGIGSSPSFALAAVNPLAGAAMGGLQEGASAYTQAIDEGMDPGEAAARAGAFGMAVIPLNKLGFDAMLRKMPSGTRAKVLGVLAASITEPVTEAAEEPLQYGIMDTERARESLATLVETGELDAGAAQVVQGMVEVAMSSVGMGGGMAAGSAGIQAAGEAIGNAKDRRVLRRQFGQDAVDMLMKEKDPGMRAALAQGVRRGRDPFQEQEEGTDLEPGSTWESDAPVLTQADVDRAFGQGPTAARRAAPPEPKVDMLWPMRPSTTEALKGTEEQPSDGSVGSGVSAGGANTDAQGRAGTGTPSIATEGTEAQRGPAAESQQPLTTNARESARMGEQPATGVQEPTTNNQQPITSSRFVPTAEWQEVPEGAVLPPGLEIRMDMKGGPTRARLRKGKRGRGPEGQRGEEPSTTNERESARMEPGPQGTKGKATTFRTSKGSTYEWDGRTSQRTKSLHPGHLTTDVGLKARSEATYFVDPAAATEIGQWMTTSNEAPQILVKDGKGLRVSRNPKTGEMGRDGDWFDLYDQPAIGLAPVELWSQSKEIPGAWTNMHPGNPITEIGGQEQVAARGVAPEIVAGVPVSEARAGESRQETVARQAGELAGQVEGATGKEGLQVGGEVDQFAGGGKMMPGAGSEDSRSEKGKQPWEMTRAEFVKNASTSNDSISFDSLTGKARPGKGNPGISVEKTEFYGYAGLTDDAVVYRDESGEPVGILLIHLTDFLEESTMEVAVKPEEQRKGIAGKLYDAARKSGFPVDEIRGQGGFTSEGALFAHSDAVRSAVAQGKPVPAEVLAEYPDLQGKGTKRTEGTKGTGTASAGALAPMDAGATPAARRAAPPATKNQEPGAAPEPTTTNQQPSTIDVLRGNVGMMDLDGMKRGELVGLAERAGLEVGTGRAGTKREIVKRLRAWGEGKDEGGRRKDEEAGDLRSGDVRGQETLAQQEGTMKETEEGNAFPIYSIAEDVPRTRGKGSRRGGQMVTGSMGADVQRLSQVDWDRTLAAWDVPQDDWEEMKGLSRAELARYRQARKAGTAHGDALVGIYRGTEEPSTSAARRAAPPTTKNQQPTTPTLSRGAQEVVDAYGSVEKALERVRSQEASARRGGDREAAARAQGLIRELEGMGTVQADMFGEEGAGAKPEVSEGDALPGVFREAAGKSETTNERESTRMGEKPGTGQRTKGTERTKGAKEAGAATEGTEAQKEPTTKNQQPETAPQPTTKNQEPTTTIKGQVRRGPGRANLFNKADDNLEAWRESMRNNLRPLDKKKSAVTYEDLGLAGRIPPGYLNRGGAWTWDTALDEAVRLGVIPENYTPETLGALLTGSNLESKSLLGKLKQDPSESEQVRALSAEARAVFEEQGSIAKAKGWLRKAVEKGGRVDRERYGRVLAEFEWLAPEAKAKTPDGDVDEDGMLWADGEMLFSMKGKEGKGKGDLRSGGVRGQETLAQQSTEGTKGDAAYLRAVEAGDMETAQRMVDAAAKAAGYEVGPVYHGTPDKRGLDATGIFTTLRERMNRATGQEAFNDPERRFYFAPYDVAKTYADDHRAWDYQNAEPGVIKAFLRFDNPITLSWRGKHWKDIVPLIEQARAKGHDGAIVHGVRDAYPSGGPASTIHVVLDPTQIKSADPVTYDEEGKVIPLSKRFQAEESDIRFSAGKKTLTPPLSQGEREPKAARRAAPPSAAAPTTRNQQPRTPKVSAAAAEGAIAVLRKRWVHGPKTLIVVQEVGDIPDVRLRRRGMRGVYDPDADTVYVVASGLDSAGEAVFVALHEVIGHRGVEGKLREGVSRILGQKRSDEFFSKLYRGRRREIARYARLVGIDVSEVRGQETLAQRQRLAAREWLADRVGAGDFDGLGKWWGKLLELVRQQLNRILGRERSHDYVGEAELEELVKAAVGRTEGAEDQRTRGPEGRRGTAGTTNTRELTPMQSIRKNKGMGQDEGRGARDEMKAENSPESAAKQYWEMTKAEYAGAQQEGMKQLTEAIAAAEVAAEEDGLAVGLRNLHEDENYSIGDTAAESFEWEDGEQFLDIPLNGTAVFEVEYVKDAIAYNVNSPNRIAVVLGDDVGSGGMPERGAFVMRDAVVFEVVHVPPPSRSWHGIQVEFAIKEGKLVPKEVMAEFPEAVARGLRMRSGGNQQPTTNNEELLSDEEIEEGEDLLTQRQAAALAAFEASGVVDPILVRYEEGTVFPYDSSRDFPDDFYSALHGMYLEDIAGRDIGGNVQVGDTFGDDFVTRFGDVFGNANILGGHLEAGDVAGVVWMESGSALLDSAGSVEVDSGTAAVGHVRGDAVVKHGTLYARRIDGKQSVTGTGRIELVKDMEGAMAAVRGEQPSDGQRRARTDKDMRQDAASTLGEREQEPDFSMAWHGTPHRLEGGEFSTAHMGKGEGAQAYGWGMYFAGKQEVAEYYRDALRPRGMLVNGKPLADWVLKILRESNFQYGENVYDEWEKVSKLVEQAFAGRNVSEPLLSAKQALERFKDKNPPLRVRGRVDRGPVLHTFRVLERMAQEGVKVSRQPGFVYQVDLKPAEDEYLLWDKPLSEQSAKVAPAISPMAQDFWDVFAVSENGRRELQGTVHGYDKAQRRMADIRRRGMEATVERAVDNDSVRGGLIYDLIVHGLGGKRQASEHLRSLGIRGIKYLDNASRDEGDGSYNYVIFDDADVAVERADIAWSMRPGGEEGTLTPPLSQGEREQEAAERRAAYDAYVEEFTGAARVVLSRLSAYFSKERGAEQGRMRALARPTGNKWLRTLVLSQSSTEAVPAENRAFNAAMERGDIRSEEFLSLVEDPEYGDVMPEMARFKKDEPKAYAAAQSMLLALDAGEERRRIARKNRQYVIIDKDGEELPTRYRREEDAETAMLDMQLADLRAQEVPESAVRFIEMFRKGMVRGYHKYKDDFDYAKKEFDAKDWESIGLTEMDVIDLGKRIREMGDLRDTYFPRLHETGVWEFYATDADGVRSRHAHDSEARAATEVVALRKEGYTVTTPRQSDQPADEVLIDANPAKVQDIFNSAGLAFEAAPRTLEEMGFEARLVDYTLKDGTVEKHLVVKGELTAAQRRVFKRYKAGYWGGDKETEGQSDKGKKGKGKMRQDAASTSAGAGAPAPPIPGGEGWRFKHVDEKFKAELAAELATADKGVYIIASNYAQQLAAEIAKLYKARGSLSRTIGRTHAAGGDVVQGYELDPNMVFSRYMMALAGAKAKRRTGEKILKAISGMDIPWEDYWETHKPEDVEDDGTAAYMDALRRLRQEYHKQARERGLHSGKQKDAWRNAMSFYRETMRNDEAADRWWGMLRGMTAVWYLSRLATGLVNLTGMAITAVPAMKTFGDIPFQESVRTLGRASSQYGAYLLEKDLGGNIVATRLLKRAAGLLRGQPGLPEKAEADWTEIFDYIRRKNWHSSQYTREALTMLRRHGAQAVKALSENVLAAQGATEELNRAGTIGGVAMVLKRRAIAEGKDWSEQKVKDEVMQAARDLSNKAHAQYGPVNLPSWMRGPEAGPQMFRSLLMFKMFPLNMLTIQIRDMLLPGLKESAEGIRKLSRSEEGALAAILNGRMQSFMWMSGAQVLLGGPTAFIGTHAANALFAALGMGDDEEPEERFYRWADERFGGGLGSRVARQGLPAVVGVNLSGSMQLDLFQSSYREGWTGVAETVLGAPGSLVVDWGDGIRSLASGDYSKGFEKLLPAFAGSPLKAYREYSRGVTTATNQPVFYGDTPLRANAREALLRGVFGSNPSGLSYKRAVHWSDTQIERKYGEAKSALLARVRSLMGGRGTARQWDALMRDIWEFNATLEERGLYQVPSITPETLAGVKRDFEKAPLRERMRASGAERERPAPGEVAAALSALRSGGSVSGGGGSSVPPGLRRVREARAARAQRAVREPRAVRR